MHENSWLEISCDFRTGENKFVVNIRKKKRKRVEKEAISEGVYFTRDLMYASEPHSLNKHSQQLCLLPVAAGRHDSTGELVGCISNRNQFKNTLSR